MISNSKATVKNIGLGANPGVVGAIGLSDILQQRTNVSEKVLERNRCRICIKGTAHDILKVPLVDVVLFVTSWLT